jgi:hypothetical protein
MDPDDVAGWEDELKVIHQSVSPGFSTEVWGYPLVNIHIAVENHHC